MDADRELKFDFFKSTKNHLALKYHKRMALGLILSPFLLGILMASFTHSPVIKVHAIHSVGYVNMVKAMDEQEALIDKVQVLDLNNVENTIKEIQKLGFAVRSYGFKDDDRLYAVGYKSLSGMVNHALVSSKKNEITITWKNVGTNSILLAEQWDHDTYPIRIIDNAKQKDVELVITHNDIKEAQQIKELEEKVAKLQQENNNIKKDYSENIIKKTLNDNPSLKGQEKEIKKYVDLIMSSKK